jgi:hypothetical protein
VILGIVKKNYAPDNPLIVFVQLLSMSSVVNMLSINFE